MKIESVYEPSFRAYGQVLTGYDTAELLRAMEAIPLPEEGTAYEPSIAALEGCGIFRWLQDHAYGGMPVQIGMCWGRNTKLNCLEYHGNAGPSGTPPGRWWRSTPRRCTTPPAMWMGQRGSGWRWRCPGAPTRPSRTLRR